MMGLDEDITSDTSTIPEDLARDAFKNPEEANFYSFDDNIVKTEVIIMPDDMLPTVQCRLCGSPDHLCSPIYNLRGGVELTEKHLETIYRLSDIIITFEKDHSSVVCAYCLLKLEEYSALREIWQMKNKTIDVNNVPAKKQHHINITYTAKTCMKDASIQTSDWETVHNAPDVRDASTCTDSISEQAAPTPEQNISAKDDGDKDLSTQSEIIDVEKYDTRLRRKRRKTSDWETVRNAPDERDASTCTDSISEEAAPTPEQNISAKDDGDKDLSTQSETIDVEEYDRRLRRERRKRQNKKLLIKEVIHLVKKQFRLEADESNHLIS